MNKYEQLIEHIINDDDAKARALFHQIVVEKSREIYESLMDEDYTEEDIHSANPVEDMVDEIQADETMQAEADDDMDLDMGDEEIGTDDMDNMEPEMGMGDMDGDEGEEDLETKVMDLESELEALKAEFEALMGNDDSEENDDNMDFAADDDNNEMPMAETQHADEEDEMTESKHDDDDEEEAEEEVTESVQRRTMPKTAVDLMREYVEKISTPSNTEFTPVGTGAGGDKPAGNTKNPLAGKNDMGGTTQNIAKGGTGADTSPDGTSPKWKPDGKLVKNVQEIDVAKRNVNKPGGNKGAQNWYSNKAGAKKGEGQTTDGSVPVQKKSIEPGGN
jgi:hypothetical protein